MHPYTIRHDPSGDEAEADSRDAAFLAARQLLEDNDFEGQCRIFQGDPERKQVVDMVWADDRSQYAHLN